MPPDKGGGASCCTLHIGCLLHTLLLHTQLHTYTSAQPSYSACSRAAYRAVHRACLHICTTFLKTESCQLSRNFQNLHSNAVLVGEYINIWSLREVICVLVEEIFYERLCSCVKIAFLDVLVCHSDHKFYERLCSCVKTAFPVVLVCLIFNRNHFYASAE